MTFIVEVYIGDKFIPQDQVKNLIINSSVLNSIIIEAAERQKAGLP